jgi:D-alanyl-D-alanine carboxypeptidase
MTDSRTALRQTLERFVDNAGVAGIALSRGLGKPLESIWVPLGFEQEPAFLAYSITKTFTAALLLLLTESCKLELDVPIARWFPRIDAAHRISIRQLLNHTSGIPDYGGLRTYHEAVRSSPTTPWSFEQFAAETYDRGLLFEPGTGWAYSNVGYMLLKRIVEEVSGDTYATLVSDRICRPLGLRRTFAAESTEDLSALAPALSAALSDDERRRDPRKHYHPGWVSHGVVASTPSDVATFFCSLFAGRLLSGRSLREMTTGVAVPRAPPQWRKPRYGLGLMLDPESPWGALLGHAGGGPGYTASAFHALDLSGQPVTVCAMCSIEEDGLAERLVREVLSLCAGASVGRPSRS